MLSRPTLDQPPLRLVRPGHHQTLTLPLRPKAEAPPVEADAAAALAGFGRRTHAPKPAAKTLPADDPRWVLAVQVSQRLQGDMLPPADRTALNRLGRSVGLNPFQTALVIAIVQDQARRGEDLAGAVETLGFVPSRSPAAPLGRWQQVLLWTGLTLAAEVALMLWLLG